MKDAAKTADLNKLSYLEPGQIVNDLSGDRYLVASKVAGPNGSVVKLANLQGEPVPTPANFTPVSRRMARFAAMMRYHLAYDKNLDRYVEEYCTRDGLPIPLGPDGQPFRWSDWFQKKIAPQLRVPVKDMASVTAVKDEAIVDMVNALLGIRGAEEIDGKQIGGILQEFHQKMKKFPKNVQKMEVARQLTVFLAKSFDYGVWIAQKYINQRFRAEEMSVEQNGNGHDEDSTYNLLDTEEHGVSGDFTEAEADRDIAIMRDGFEAWLKTRLSEKASKWFITLFDIYWNWVTTETSEEETEAGRPAWMPARRELEPQWEQMTGLNKASLYAYIGRLHQLLREYIKENREQLGESNVWVKLLDQIEREREKLKAPKKRKAPAKAMPAHASLAALDLAAAEEEPVAKTARLIPGTELTPEMREQVVNSFHDRWTIDNPKRLERWGKCDACDVQNAPFVGGDASGHNHPTVPLVTDEEWIAGRQFHFYNDGRLNPRSHAERMLASAENTDTKTAEFAENILPADLPTEEELMTEGERMDRDHEFCPTCGECTTCNLRPCRDGGPHQPGVKKGAAEISGKQECCGAFKPKHKEDCKEHNETWDKTLNLLRHKRSAASEDLADAAENVLQARADQMLTPDDWDILNQAVRMANRTPLREACRALLHAHDSGMLTSEEWENAAQALADETGRNVGWRSHDEMKDDQGDGLNKPVLDLKESAKKREDQPVFGEMLNIWEEPSEKLLHFSEPGNTDQTLCGMTIGYSSWAPAGQNYMSPSGLHMLKPSDAEDLTDHAAFVMCPACEEQRAKGGKNAAIGHEFYDGIRPQITEGDTGRVPHGRTQGSVYNKNASKWRVTLRDPKGRERHELVRGLTYDGAERAVQKRMKPGEVVVSMTVASKKAFAGEMSHVDPDEYPLWFYIAKRIGGEVKPFDVYQGPYIYVPGFGKFWISSDDGFMGTIYSDATQKQSNPFPMDQEEGGVDGVLETLEGMDRKRMEKRIQGVIDAEENPSLDFEQKPEDDDEHTAAGPISPQQMQQQNVQHSQGVAMPQIEDKPQQPPQPAVAIEPESGSGENIPMRRTVPPELANPMLHMQGGKKSSVLVDKKAHFDRAYRKQTQ